MQYFLSYNTVLVYQLEEKNSDPKGKQKNPPCLDWSYEPLALVSGTETNKSPSYLDGWLQDGEDTCSNKLVAVPGVRPGPRIYIFFEDVFSSSWESYPDPDILEVGIRMCFFSGSDWTISSRIRNSCTIHYTLLHKRMQ